MPNFIHHIAYKAMKLSRLTFYLVLTMGVLPLQAQKKLNPDSLLQLIPNMVDTQKMLAYYDICRYYVGANKNKSIEAAQAALTIAERKNDDKWIARCLNVLFSTLNIHGESKNNQVLAEKALQHAIKSKSKTTILEAYESLANTYGMKSMWDKAIEYSDQCLLFATEIKDTVGLLNAYNMLALCNLELNRAKLAIQYHQNSVVLSQKIGRVYELGRAYAGLAEVNMKQGNWQEAMLNAKKGAESFKKMNYPIGQAQSLVFAGAALLQLHQLDECRLICKEILSLLDEAGNDAVRGDAHNILGYVEMEEGRYGLATEHFKKAEKEARKSTNYKLLKDIYRGMEILSALQNNFEAARDFHHQFQVVSDSSLSQQIVSNITNYQVKYETAEKEKLLAEEQEKKSKWILGSIIALLLLTGLFFYQRKQQQMQKNQARLEAEKSRLEAELEHREANRLREVDKIKSTFFANISHEIRTPLSLIIGPLEQMINGSFKGDQQKYYRIMHKNGKRLLELVNQLLLLSKLESGRMKLTGSFGNIHNLIKAIVNSFENLADRRNIQIDIDCPDEEGKCCFDRDAVEKIMANLLSNAIKFSNDGGSIFVTIRPMTGQTIQIEVMDTGIGISEEQIPSLFERFSKTTHSELQPGSGLGLALVKELSELHGGGVTVKSKEGEGSVFTVTMRVDRSFFDNHQFTNQTVENEASTFETLVSDTASISEGSKKLNPQKIILVVEDNADVRTYIKDQLQGNYLILEATNGREGLEVAMMQVPDIIITDIMMPELDGLSLCKLIKKHPLLSHIPVIMLTSKTEEADKISGLEAGADDFLTKPFLATELVLKIKNWLTTRIRLQEKYLSPLNPFSPDALQEENMDAKFIQNVRDTIQLNLDDEGFSVVELSQKVGFSRSQLHRKLSALTGKGPNEIIRSMRLENAKQLLEQKAGNVSEIAYRCGFNSPAYFIKCYKDQYGTTPGDVL
ncbi:MAG: response regulator [Saprospiraceae bacterium]|nr:response regulator [Saprospiraceae bacterium]